MVSVLPMNEALQPPASPQASEQPSYFQQVNARIVATLGGLSCLHVPMFNFLFQLKKNTFLTTEDAQAQHLEAAGNWMLTPARYLLTGKTIEQIQAGRIEQMRPSFSYAEESAAEDIFKTILAICSLPISLIIGSIFKGLSYMAPSVREKHQMIHHALQTLPAVDNTEIYRQFNIDQPFSNQTLPHQNHPTPAPTQSQIAHMEAVRDVAALLKERSIPHWMDCGTLLGAYRHGKMIPWDTDVDMGILSIDFANAYNTLRQLDPEKYEVQDWSCSRSPNLFLRVLIKEENSYLDLYPHRLNPDNQTVCYEYSWKDSPWVPHALKRRELVQIHEMQTSDIFPLNQAQFGDALISVPRNWESFLRIKYGDDLRPCKIWNEATQQYERVADHPYWNMSDF